MTTIAIAPPAALGRHANRFLAGTTRVARRTVLVFAGVEALIVFAIVRASQG